MDLVAALIALYLLGMIWLIREARNAPDGTEILGVGFVETKRKNRHGNRVH